VVIFDDVDVFLPVERELGATRAAIPYVIRRANHKSYLEIHREIRAFQSQPVQPGTGMPAAFLFMMSMPWPLPRLCIRVIRAVGRRDPTRLVTTAGTVGVTALGMAGRGGGWGLAPAGQSVLLIVGGIARKPAVIEERVEPRDLLDLTVAFDHDVVDGAPAARFVKRLVELIESGYGWRRRGKTLPLLPPVDAELSWPESEGVGEGGGRATRISTTCIPITGSTGLSRRALRRLTVEHTGLQDRSGLGDLGTVKVGLPGLAGARYPWSESHSWAAS
jgi:hypothetical protein